MVDYEQEKDSELSYPRNLKSRIDKSKEDKSTTARVWDLCIHFLEGKQHLSWSKSSQAFGVDNRGQSSRRVTINLLLNIFRNIVSRLSTTYPGIVVLPAGPDKDDIIKAKSSEVALKYYWHRNDMKAVLNNMVEWLATTGNAFLHTYYDPQQKEVITKSLSPYDVFYEPGVNRPIDAAWVSVRTFVRKPELLRAYPNKKEIIEKASTTSKSNNDPADGFQTAAHRIELFETYFQSGKYCIHIGDDVLFVGTTPKNLLPVQHIRYTEVPNRLWGMGLLFPLIELQSLYNKVRTQIVTNVDLMSNPKWLIPKTSGVNPGAITNRPGEKVYFNLAGGTPTQLPAVSLPPQVFQNVQQLHSEILDVSGVHSTSLGKRAQGITAGKAILALAKQDQSQLQLTQIQIERAVKETAKCALVFMKTYYTEAKMIRMLDLTGQVIFDKLQATNIVDDPEIFMQANSLFRDEAQDRDAKVLELLEKQLIPPDIAMQELSFRTGDGFALQRMTDKAHAQDILEHTINGAAVEIYKTDNLKAFLEVFGHFMKSAKYYDLPAETQNYIRNIYVAVGHALDPQRVPQPISADHKVFPIEPQGDLVEGLAVLDSERNQAQVLAGKVAHKQKAAQISATEGLSPSAVTADLAGTGGRGPAVNPAGVETTLPAGSA